MNRNLNTFLTKAGMYLIALVLLIIAAVMLSAGNVGAGIGLGFAGLIYLGGLSSYSKKQKRKREMREAYTEAQEDLAKKKQKR
jgi:hypothetical protein